MKFDRLLYFLAVARHQHVGKAAKQLHISPSAISHSIHALESELNCKLFEQKGRRITITDTGRVLQERAEALLAQADKLREEITSAPLKLSGTIRVGASHLLSSTLVVSAFAKLHQQYPDLHCEILTHRSANVVDLVLAGELDLGVCFSPQNHVALETKPLCDGKLVVAVRKRHPILKEKTPIKHLSKYPAVLPKSFRGIEVCEKHPMFKKHGIIARPICLYDNYNIALQLLQVTNGWSLVPDRLLSDLKADLELVPLPRDWHAPYQISALWLRHRAFNASMKAMVSEIQTLLA